MKKQNFKEMVRKLNAIDYKVVEIKYDKFAEVGHIKIRGNRLTRTCMNIINKDCTIHVIVFEKDLIRLVITI